MEPTLLGSPAFGIGTPLHSGGVDTAGSSPMSDHHPHRQQQQPPSVDGSGMGVGGAGSVDASSSFSPSLALGGGGASPRLQQHQHRQQRQRGHHLLIRQGHLLVRGQVGVVCGGVMLSRPPGRVVSCRGRSRLFIHLRV